MMHTGLQRPRTIPANFSSILNRDGQVLVPGHLPVSIRSFIEQRRAHYERFFPQHLTSNLQDRSVMRDFVQLRHKLQHIARATLARTVELGRLSFNQSKDMFDLSRVQQAGRDGEAVLFELLAPGHYNSIA